MTIADAITAVEDAITARRAEDVPTITEGGLTWTRGRLVAEHAGLRMFTVPEDGGRWWVERTRRADHIGVVLAEICTSAEADEILRAALVHTTFTKPATS